MVTRPEAGAGFLVPMLLFSFGYRTCSDNTYPSGRDTDDKSLLEEKENRADIEPA